MHWKRRGVSRNGFFFWKVLTRSPTECESDWKKCAHKLIWFAFIRKQTISRSQYVTCWATTHSTSHNSNNTGSPRPRGISREKRLKLSRTLSPWAKLAQWWDVVWKFSFSNSRDSTEILELKIFNSIHDVSGWLRAHSVGGGGGLKVRELSR